MRGYVIASSPRSGTNFLCELLRSTGTLGAPQDWFNGPGIRRREDPLYPLAPEAQLQAILTLGTTPNGVFGVKMFCQRFDMLRGFDWANYLPNLRWIHLERRDLLGQAISDVRTAQTDQYRSTAPGTGQAHYDAGAIRRSMRRCATDHARWRLYFARNGIQALHLSYEDVSAVPQQAIDAVAAWMDVHPAPAIDWTKLTLAIQRNAISDYWRARYLQEARSFERLDVLAPTTNAGIADRLNRIWT